MSLINPYEDRDKLLTQWWESLSPDQQVEWYRSQWLGCAWYSCTETTNKDEASWPTNVEGVYLKCVEPTPCSETWFHLETWYLTERLMSIAKVPAYWTYLIFMKDKPDIQCHSHSDRWCALLKACISISEETPA